MASAAALLCALALSGCDDVERKALGALFQRGQALEQMGDREGAVDAYREALALHESHVPSLMALGGMAEAEGSIASAMGYYARAADTGWPGNGAFLALSRLHRERGELAQALRFATSATRLNPDDADSHAQKAAVTRAAGLSWVAVDSAAAALALDPSHGEATLELALATAEQRGVAAGVDFMARAPGRHDRRVLDARLALIDEEGKPQHAIDVLHLEIRNHRLAAEQDIEALGALSRELAERLIHRGELDAAGEALDARLHRVPRDLETLLARAELTLAVEGADPALVRLRRGIAAAGLAASSAAALRLEANLMITAGAFDDARAQLARAEARSQDHPEAPTLIRARALRWERAGKRAEALETAIAAFLAEPGDEETAALILRLAGATGRHAAASAALESAMVSADGPLDVTTVLTLLQLRAMAGRSADIEEAFAQLMRRTGTSNRVAIAYAAYLEGSGRRDDARELLNALHEARPGATDLALALGRLMIRDGDAAGAAGLALALTDDAATRSSQASVAVRLVSEALGAGIEMPVETVAALRERVPRLSTPALVAAAYPATAPAEAAQVVTEAPGRAEGYLMRARQFDGADPVIALDHLDAGVGACRYTMRLRLRRAGLSEAVGRYEDALQDYAVLHAIAPQSLVVVNNFASLLAEHRDDPASMSRAAELASRLEGYDVAEFLDTQGWIAARRGEVEDGLALLERAAARLGDRPAVHYHLGFARLWAGDTAGGRAALQRAVDLDTEARFRYYGAAREVLAKAGIDDADDGGRVKLGSDFRTDR